MAKRVAVLLSGCGFKDGTEIHEATCALLALDQAGCEVVGVAPTTNQTQVVNHLDGNTTDETRNIMTEAARIMRGNIQSTDDIKPSDFDALIIPGGFGAVVNLCNYGKVGRKCEIDNDVKDLIMGFMNAGLPIGAICIAPVVVARALEGTGNCVNLTIGNDSKIAADIEAMGAKHVKCAVGDVVVDRQNKVVSTPAYMLGKWIGEVNEGVVKLVTEVVGLMRS